MGDTHSDFLKSDCVLINLESVKKIIFI